MATGNKVVSGARAQLWANGNRVGVATGVDATDNLRQQPLAVLDMLAPDGFVTVGSEVSVTVARAEIPGTGMVAMGLWPKADIDETVHKSLILDFPEIEFRIYDSKTGIPMAIVKGAVPGNRQIRFQPGQIVIENATFPALVVGDGQSAAFA